MTVLRGRWGKARDWQLSLAPGLTHGHRSAGRPTAGNRGTTGESPVKLSLEHKIIAGFGSALVVMAAAGTVK